MSQSEWNNAWESAQKILILYIPYVIASLVISICQYLEKHWRKEPFSLAKLITGILSDIVFGMTLVLGALWLSSGNHICAMFVLFVGLSRGRKWADSVVDRMLWNRYGNGYGDQYGQYGQDITQQNQNQDQNQDQKQDNSQDQKLDPRE